MRAKRLAIIVSALTTLSLGLYTLNPSGTASLDFRGRVFGIVPFHIPSTSMEPTINPGDYILVSTYAYKNHPIETKDVIVFQYPKDPSREYVKRVIGLAGDTVLILNDIVHINGNPIEEPYIQNKHQTKTKPSTRKLEWRVPDGHVFVLGDNRHNSSDSRNWGAVSQGAIVGQVAYIINARTRTIRSDE